MSFDPSEGAGPAEDRPEVATPPADVPPNPPAERQPSLPYPGPGFVNWGYPPAPAQYGSVYGPTPPAGWPANQPPTQPAWTNTPSWATLQYGVPPQYGVSQAQPAAPQPYAPQPYAPQPYAPQPNAAPPAYTWFSPQGGYAQSWGYQPPYGAVGWAPGYPYPPFGFPPVALEAPGKLHPPQPSRRFDSVAGRASPGLYILGWLLTLFGLSLLGALIIGGRASLTGLSGPALAGVVFIGLAAAGAGFLAAALAQGSQRRADGWQDYAGPSPFLVVGAWLCLSNAAILLVVGLLRLVNIELATSVELLLLLIVNGVCYFAIVQVVAVRTGALSWADMIGPRHLAPALEDWFDPSVWAQNAMAGGRRIGRALMDSAVGAGLAFPLTIGTLILAGILVTALGMQHVNTESPLPVTTDWDLWITLLAAAVVAPIAEEIFFRGFATNAWARSLERNSALIRAAIFFAAIHLINVDFAQKDPSILVRAAFLAVAVRIPVAYALAWVYTRRRSIFASAALHMTYNALLVFIAYWAARYYTQ
jgi:membrane protease YdiL (CAAX protease family)